MRVLIIQTNAIANNGVTNVVFNYLKAFPEDDINVDIFSKNDPAQSFKDVVKRFGGKIYPYPRTSKNIVRRWNYLRRLIKSNHYDIVHVHCNSHIAFVELLAAKLGGCKIRIVHSHNTSTSYPIIHKMLTPFFNKLYTHGIACGKEAGKWMFGNRKFQVFNNGIDTERFAFDNSKRNSIRTQLGLSETDVLIGHVGHFLGEVKNQSFLVEIFRVLSKENHYKLCLIGDGPQKKMIEQVVLDYGLNNKVFFTGNIDNVDCYLNAIDMIIMPSLYEGLPLTLIEQQANGLICLCSDTITKEVDKTGYLRFISLGESAEKWAQVARESVDVSNREKQSKNAIKLIESSCYSIQKEAIKLLQFYKDCVCNSSINNLI